MVILVLIDPVNEKNLTIGMNDDKMTKLMSLLRISRVRLSEISLKNSNVSFTYLLNSMGDFKKKISAKVKKNKKHKQIQSNKEVISKNIDE